MTYIELKKLNYKIQEQNLRLVELKEEKNNIQSPKFDNMPKGNTNLSGIENIVERIELKEKEIKELQETFNKYINDISDSFIRTMIELKIKKGWSWTKIALSLGGNNTKDSVRMFVIRYKW